jgi:hypothetical protein
LADAPAVGTLSWPSSVTIGTNGGALIGRQAQQAGPRRLAPRKRVLRRDVVPARLIRHDRSWRLGLRHDSPLDLVAPATGSTGGIRGSPSVRSVRTAGDQWPGIKFFYLSMNSGLGALPDGIEALKAAPVAERGERISLDMFPNTAARASVVSTKMARPSPIMASSA